MLPGSYQASGDGANILGVPVFSLYKNENPHAPTSAVAHTASATHRARGQLLVNPVGREG